LCDLIDAFQQIQQQLNGVRLLIVGDGPSCADVKSYAAERGVKGVVFAGQQIEGVSDYFLAGDLFVLPHLGGLAISEAMAHGLPVVATIADGCEVDLIEDGRNGYICKVGDISALADRMFGILSNDAVLKSMKDRSSWIIENRHNVHSYLDGIVAAVRYAARSNVDL
jgi:glycosyltransferase involved in cell wall biosynthesis